MQELKLFVPTYYGAMHAKTPTSQGDEDFGEPSVPVLIQEAEGIRVVLGAHGIDDSEKPEIQLERRPNGWALFLYPVAGGDASGLVYFLDDGRSFVVPDGLYSERIQVVNRCEEVPLIDDPVIDVLFPKPDVIAGGSPRSSDPP